MVIQVGKDVLPNGLWLRWRAWCENWAFAGAASEASFFFFATPPERYWRRKKVTIVSNVFYMVFSMDDNLSVLRPIHLLCFGNAYEKHASHAGIYSRLLWVIDKNWCKSWYFIRGVDAFQNLLYVCSENGGFSLFSMVPSGKPNSPPLFLQKSNIEKNGTFGKLMKTI